MTSKTWLLCGEDELVKNWIVERVDGLHRLNSCTAIAVMSGKRIIAGVAYYNHQPEARWIQINMAAISPMWAKKSVIKRLLQYPFEQLNCYKIMLDVNVNNTKALKTFKSIGFEQEAVLSHVHGVNQHCAVLHMLKSYYVQEYGVKPYDEVLVQIARKPEIQQEIISNHSHGVGQTLVVN